MKQVYKLIKEKDTAGRNHNAAYSIKNYLTKDFDENFSVVVTELEDGRHEPTKNIASDRVYYFISAEAEFVINGEIIIVSDGDVLFIEKNTFYSFKGSFKAVLISMPAFRIENDVNLSKQAYFVYPGLGKTTLAKINPAIADIETKIFKDASLAEYIGAADYPNFRGPAAVKINPEWPDNLNEFARREMAAGKIIVSVPKQDSYDLLNTLRVTDYAFIMPDADRLEQLRRDYIARGDDAEYIKPNLMERYNAVLDYARKVGKEIIFLKPGQYLADVLG
ncbi:MAG: hypothetical protein LBJ18_01190 [Rickettsiales bacterium]|jgi:mannose-6-phosphate isomerase-like protein (cupin superfamily)|nr:hypothetical protein [Rickettsiales bacterium]